MKSLQESILSSVGSGREEFIKEKMGFISKNCKYGEDYTITKDGVEITGVCTSLVLGRTYDRNGFKFSKIEPERQCLITLKSENGKYLPKVLGKEGKSEITLRLGIANDEVSYKDLPEMVYGNIHFEGGKSLDLTIMPQCTGEIIIREDQYGKIIYPKGFPTKAKEIKIYRK